ncbi:MAG: hypothetical protein ACLFUB_08525 [Cyclobacteriaceae bacterium]
MKKRYIFGPLIVLLMAWFVREAVTQPGIQDLAGAPEEVAFVRNENNTGPVKRIYVVSIADTLWQEMEKYGSFMPHNKYGNTQVYFFLKGQPHPESLSLETAITEEYQPYCLARFEKNAMGSESFVRYPFAMN